MARRRGASKGLPTGEPQGGRRIDGGTTWRRAPRRPPPRRTEQCRRTSVRPPPPSTRSTLSDAAYLTSGRGVARRGCALTAIFSEASASRVARLKAVSDRSSRKLFGPLLCNNAFIFVSAPRRGAGGVSRVFFKPNAFLLGENDSSRWKEKRGRHDND